ncbi:MAG TPA: tail fiber protein [Pseudolabrys sp.]|nr:tail fiber protein [Pseudolabrys sp.]
MSDVFIGQILMFGGNFAPRGFAFCNGQLLSIAQNQALFALIGTTYGGNGIQNFALPNLQSSVPVHSGHGTGLSSYALGQTGGSPAVTLTTPMMPAHTHSLNATKTQANTGTIGMTVVPGVPVGTDNPEFYIAQQQGAPPPQPQPMAAAACGPAGANQPHTNLMPSLCITFIIALQGIFPSRS